jgi:hypothetical protein
VVVAVKKVIAIDSMPIIVISDEELAVEVAMDIAMVVVADADVDIAIPDMDMLSMLMDCGLW